MEAVSPPPFFFEQKKAAEPVVCGNRNKGQTISRDSPAEVLLSAIPLPVPDRQGHEGLQPV